jgi:prolyl-tRNA synthetase
MRWSRSLIPTLRDDPADAEAISHKLMVRAGLVRQLAAGIYVYLPVGQRTLDKVNAIIREEMNAIGGQEITMPVLHPAEIWQQSGRWEGIPEMFRLRDRHGRDMCLGMTHEEVIAWLAAREIRSYRDLPQIWYQIQTKERDEARPRSGVLRTREFLMKDSYTLDPDLPALDRSYAAHDSAYRKIFSRVGVLVHVVESDTGMMGGLGSHEFMAPSAAGEDDVAMCAACGYAANVELARGVPSAAPEGGPSTTEEVPTPGVRTIAEVAARLSIDAAATMKSLVFIAPAGPVLALVRGDHVLHERKLARALKAEARPAQAEEITAALGVAPGSIGPVGVHGVSRILADESLRQGRYTAGANRDGFHLRGVTAGRDFACEFADLQTAVAGEGCPRCGAPLAVERVIEVGNIFKLGTTYSVPLGATYLDEQGQQQPVVMGSYGIGPARIVAAAIEQRHDPDGIVWPWSIAPFHVELIPIAVKDRGNIEVAESLYEELGAAGFEVLLDDRDERAGVKFKDADLLGCPIRVVIGQAYSREGVIEVRERGTRREVKVPRDRVLKTIQEAAETLRNS